MCGRTACTLDKCGIQLATCRYSKNKESLKWVEKYDWQNYQPCYNLSPSQVSPVLVSDSVLFPKEKLDNFVIMPMRWGLIPSWYKGLLKDFDMKTNNCRLESILERPTFRGAAISNQRCVILADGFYEWKASGNKQKQPYFLFFSQNENPDVILQDKEFSIGDNERKGLRLLTMAGIFDMWKTPKKEVIYSYSVITLDASKAVSFVHSRMPAILENADEIAMWLDRRVSTKQALSILKPVENLEMYPVSTLVNNSRNDSIDCIKPLSNTEKSATTFKCTALTSWLKRETSSGSDSKRFKSDS